MAEQADTANVHARAETRHGCARSAWGTRGTSGSRRPHAERARGLPLAPWASPHRHWCGSVSSSLLQVVCPCSSDRGLAYGGECRGPRARREHAGGSARGVVGGAGEMPPRAGPASRLGRAGGAPVPALGPAEVLLARFCGSWDVAPAARVADGTHKADAAVWSRLVEILVSRRYLSLYLGQVGKPAHRQEVTPR